MTGHFLKRCECGRVLAQCRCPGPKVATVVRPCTCEAVEEQPAERPPVAFDELPLLPSLSFEPPDDGLHLRTRSYKLHVFGDDAGRPVVEFVERRVDGKYLFQCPECGVQQWCAANERIDVEACGHVRAAIDGRAIRQWRRFRLA